MNQSIILFDGVCNFCNASVNFVINNDKRDTFRFAAIQSPSGQKLLKDLGIDTNKMPSFYLILHGNVYTRSTASLKVLGSLPWYFSWMYVFILLPAPIRDFFYGIIAKNRYRIWGKRDKCMVPSEKVKNKFLL